MRTALAFLFCSSLLSQSRIPGPSKPIEKQQNKTSPKSGEPKPDDNLSKERIPNGVAIPARNDQKDSRSQGEAKSPTDWWGIFNTALSTIFTGVLALLAYRQWKTLKGHEESFKSLAGFMGEGLAESRKSADAAMKMAETADLALRLAERADILLVSAEFLYEEGVVAILRDSSIVISFSNFGRTRANKVRFNTTLVVTGVFEEKFSVGPVAIGPGQNRKVVLRRLQKLFPENVVAGVLSGILRMYFTGTAIYEDVFSEPHTIDYIGVFDPPSLGFLMEDPQQPKADDSS
jgi:hypothetical protein